MAWTVGDVSGSQTLTTLDHLYETHINELRVASDLKALDSAIVHNTGNETIAGAKTFSTAPIVPTSAFPETAVSSLVNDLAARLQLGGDVIGTATTPRVKSRESTVVVGPSGSFADYVCTGSSDQALINTALTAATNAKAAIRAGTYDIQGLVSPKAGNTIIGEGYGTLFQLGSGSGKTLKLQTISHVTMRDFRVDGTNIPSSNAFGMLVDQCDDVTIDHVWVLNCNGFGVFLSTAGATEHGKIRVVNSYITGQGNADVLGGGPSDAAGVLSELIITGNYVAQGVGASPGIYGNAIDIVAQTHTVIENNETQGSIILGGEKIPHLNVSVAHNIIRPAQNSTYGRVAILCASNAGETDDSKGISIDHNHITSGHIYAQGQGTSSNRTRKLIIDNNTIGGLKTDPNTELNWGLDLNYLADVKVHHNTVDGSDRGIYLNDITTIDISDNSFLNCNTPIVIGPQPPTNMTGHNNIGINPDVLYAKGNITGAVSFDRINGLEQTATIIGNIAVTLPDTYFKGELMTLVLTQDGTGSRTVTWPSNFKKAGGTLTLTTAAGATDVVAMRWDGTNWQEVSRALNVS